MEWLNDMALFVEVVNAKGFGKAADKLGIAKSTLSVRIARLEQHIGLQLLVSPQSVSEHLAHRG